ncbi:MAG: STAS domain-containing protein [Paracoccaceae bacterium]|jgi:anti-sigma B factor antagonist|nr:STAS domain-containing protein [Paracoccaceae bacterium]
MNLISQELDGVSVISVVGLRIDAACAIQFKDRFRELAPENKDRVILDLDGVDFVDSSGLGAIVGIMKLLAPNTRLELSGMCETVKKVFTLTRMDRVFAIHNKVSDAIACEDR